MSVREMPWMADGYALGGMAEVIAEEWALAETAGTLHGRGIRLLCEAYSSDALPGAVLHRENEMPEGFWD